MSRLSLSLAIHNHQPVGNFDHVIEDAYRKAYLPFLETLSRYPEVPFGLHHSGPLLDWLERSHPEYLDTIRSMVERGQVEVIGGAYEEPLLPMIPPHDGRGQIDLMRRRSVELFGHAPAGVWLAERVWEPFLPSLLSPPGIRYTVLDDAHFLYAGLSPDDLVGPFTTEHLGEPLIVFPIAKRLRYTIPFEDPEATLEYLDQIRSHHEGDILLTFADDGEKFGVWPGTHDLCYVRGWLSRFVEALLARPDIQLTTPGRAIEAFRSRGRVYLPAASYLEMLEWALPARSIHDYEDFLHVLDQRDLTDKYGRFVRGGYTPNFLAKYPEVDHLHKRVLQVSERLRRLEDEDVDIDAVTAAKRSLWRSQCNCAYWHGVFGGAYLPHLRNAVWAELLSAERQTSEIARSIETVAETVDLDLDGRAELHVRTPHLVVHAAPAIGGSILELSLRERNANLLDTFSRREEGYHRKLREAGKAGDEGEQVPSIHDRVESKEEGLADLLAVDSYRRSGFVDHFLGPDTTLEDFESGAFQELGDFSTGVFEGRLNRHKSATEMVITKRGCVAMPWGRSEITVEKHLKIREDTTKLEAKIAITNHDERTIDLWYGSEWNWALLAPDADDRFYELDGKRLSGDSRLRSSGTLEGVTCFGLVDGWRDITVRFRLEDAALFWRCPLETISISEAGFERVFQAATTVTSWRFTLSPSRTWRTRYTIYLEHSSKRKKRNH